MSSFATSHSWNINHYIEWIQAGCPENLTVTHIMIRSLPKKFHIPPEIGLLSNLVLLDFQDNEITSIPPEIGKLQNLVRLYLTKNLLTSIPAELGNLLNLETLSLSQNLITSIPVELGKLLKLESLFLCNNNLTSFPSGIYHMRNLKVLWMSVNSITSLPVEIGNLHNLEKLILSHNNLTSLPTEIGNLVNLHEIFLVGNRLTSLPPEIGDLPNLSELMISENELTYIPRNVRRIIERQRRPRGIYGDAQSVHNSTIQKTIKESIMRLLKERETHRDVIELILSDTVLTDFTKESLVDYAGDTSVHTELNLTFHDLLVTVWNRIFVLPNSGEIKAVLNAEMRDAACMCFTGRISRLVNCLNGFDPLVTIQISDNEQIGNIISLVKTQLTDNNEYTIERHKDVVRTRLEELGIVDEEIEAWLKHIE